MDQPSLFDGLPDKSHEQEWDEKNPRGWREFERRALFAIRQGRTRYSAWTIVNVIRWHVDMETTGSEFKIPNEMMAYYARKFHRLYPQHAGFFHTKPSKLDRDVA